MTDPLVRLQRAESALYERLCEAIASLEDEELAGLVVLGAVLARDKKDATVMIDGGGAAQEDRAHILAKLRKASGYIASYVAGALSWRRCPILHFRFDDSLENRTRLDAIFDRIHKGDK
ncbi:MAG: 30S ribosome-binding factor RbfA [Helicobacteraceae bacterium]|jgi:ribosome-binding factor A|nr:30S ribosome-binding factor RbfA [Helicobacteraceae bacterium]